MEKKQILIVDDEAGIRDLIKEYLSWKNIMYLKLWTE